MSLKPKCITCPFWENFDEPDKLKNGDKAKSRCRRFPPADEQEWFPEMRGNEWCGEHPAFAAWIASPGPKPPAMTPYTITRGIPAREVEPSK